MRGRWLSYDLHRALCVERESESLVRGSFAADIVYFHVLPIARLCFLYALDVFHLVERCHHIMPCTEAVFIPGYKSDGVKSES